MRRVSRVLLDTIIKNKVALIMFCLISLINGAVFFLYDITNEALIYSEMLFIFLLLCLLLIDFVREYRKAKIREEDLRNALNVGFKRVDHENLADRDYAAIIEELLKEIRNLEASFSTMQQDDQDYYTSWVHQIKTPIAVMKLSLAEDTMENRALLSELFRIEQYVEMVLDYGRLRSTSNDLLIKEYELDPIIRENLRKHAGQFVLKKLKLNYDGTDAVVVSDRKWLSFIVDQLISNAIKYTPSGEISIKADQSMISISDTGIGIASEDLPRIFEKGYTGVNGRLGEKSSGLGLFLTKKAADLISVTVTCKSEVSKGSTFTIRF